MIQFRLYVSKEKSPSRMTDDEARNAEYRDTKGVKYVKTGKKVGAAAGAIYGLTSSLGRRGIIGTALSTATGAALGSMAGAAGGALAKGAVGISGYTGRKVTGTSQEAAKQLKKEGKKFSNTNLKGKVSEFKEKINDSTESTSGRLGLVGASTLAGAGLGSVIGVANAKRSNKYKDLLNLKNSGRPDVIKGMKKITRKAGRRGALVGGLAVAAGGMKLAMDKKRRENERYNEELRRRKESI